MMPKRTWKNNRKNNRERQVSYPADSGGAGISSLVSHSDGAKANSPSRYGELTINLLARGEKFGLHLLAAEGALLLRSGFDD
jgi:hypothetical protein